MHSGLCKEEAACWEVKMTSVQDRTDPVFCSADLPLFPIYFSNTCSKSDAMCSDIKQLLAFFLRYNNSNFDQC